MEPDVGVFRALCENHSRGEKVEPERTAASEGTHTRSYEGVDCVGKEFGKRGCMQFKNLSVS